MTRLRIMLLGVLLLGSASPWALASPIDPAAGAWVFTTAALATGAHSFTVTTTTSSGIESAASDPWVVTTDTAAPAKPGTFTVTDDVGLRTGSLAVIGTVTDDDVLTLSGTVEAGAARAGDRV